MTERKEIVRIFTKYDSIPNRIIMARERPVK